MTAAPGGRRELFVSISLMALAAVVTFIAAQGPRVSIDGGQVSGATTPAATALALVALAGSGTLLFLGSTGRRVVGLLLVLAGAGIVALMLRQPDTTWFTYAGADQPPVLRRSAWAYAGAASGLILALVAAWTVVRAPSWPRRTLPATGGAARGGPGSERPPATPWEAIDRGEDPTE